MAWGAAGLAAAGMVGGMMSSRSAAKRSAAAMEAATAESKRQYDISMAEMRKAAEYLESIGFLLKRHRELR